jgi:uncharacterized protein
MEATRFSWRSHWPLGIRHLAFVISPSVDFSRLDHRPWPLPRGPWAMSMCWHDLLFAHWPIDPAKLRPLVPSGLELDTWDGAAWLGVVLFRMTGVRPRGCPPLRWWSAFSEINLRTYVTADGRPGVWFFSLDATNKWAVRAARWGLHLNYYDAAISVDVQGEEVSYRALRTHRAAPEAEFQARYRPRGEAERLRVGTLEHWFIERYCLYTADAHDVVWRLNIHHDPWTVRSAEAEISANTLARPLGLELPPLPAQLHFAQQLDAVAWLPHRA